MNDVLTLPDFLWTPLQFDWVADAWRSCRWLELGNYE